MCLEANNQREHNLLLKLIINFKINKYYKQNSMNKATLRNS